MKESETQMSRMCAGEATRSRLCRSKSAAARAEDGEKAVRRPHKEGRTSVNEENLRTIEVLNSRYALGRRERSPIALGL